MEHKTTDGWRARLADDGTIDAVLIVSGPDGKSNAVRFDCEYVSQYRKADGSLTLKGFKTLANEAIESEAEAAYMHKLVNRIGQ